MADAAPAAAHGASLDAYVERHRLSGDRTALAVFARLDSTNRLAVSIARGCAAAGQRPPALIAVAREQLAGRGRRGRRWQSPAGLGIYTSLLLRVADGAALAALPLRVPVALAEALAPVLGEPCGIKWPNDLMAADRKLGGVLIEAPGRRVAVVGYGINVGQQGSELPAGATSVRRLTGRAPELAPLTIDLAIALGRRLAAPEPTASVLAAYRQLSVHRPGDELFCRLEGAEVRGVFAGFDDAGRLLLETAAGERALSAAELIETPAAERR